MALNAKPVLKVDANDPTKQWIEFSGQEGMTATPLQYTLTPQQFSAFQAAGLQATRESNNPLYYNQGAFNDAALTRIGQLATPLSGGIGDVGQQAQSRQYLTDWTNILGQYQTKLPTATPATLNDPYADTTLWQKTPYMGGSQVTYIGPKGGPQDPDKGINTGLSNVQAPAMTQAGSNIGNASIPTASTINQGIQDLLKRIQTEGITQGGKQILAPGSLATSGGQITPNLTMTAQGLQGEGAKAIDLSGTTGNTPNTSSSIVAGGEATVKSIQDYINLMTPPETPESKQYKDLLAQIQGELPGITGKGAAQLAAEQEQGVAAKKQALLDVQNQITTKMAEYKALATQLEGKPITMNSIIGGEAQIQKAMASDIGLLQAQAQVLQGNLTLAQDTANRAVDLKFSDANDLINTQLKQLSLIQDQLSKSEKIRADAITAYLNDQKTKIAIATANEKDKNATILNLMQKYPDAGWTGIPATVAEASAKIQNSAIYKKEIKSQQTLADQNLIMRSQASQAFESVKGQDGYISPSDWSKLLTTWLGQGGLLKDFEDNFNVYQNPKDTYQQ